MSRIDVEHRADGVSLTLADNGYSLNVRLSQMQVDELIEQLTMESCGRDGSDPEADGPPSAGPRLDPTRVGC